MRERNPSIKEHTLDKEIKIALENVKKGKVKSIEQVAKEFNISLN